MLRLRCKAVKTAHQAPCLVGIFLNQRQEEDNWCRVCITTAFRLNGLFFLSGYGFTMPHRPFWSIAENELLWNVFRISHQNRIESPHRACKKATSKCDWKSIQYLCKRINKDRSFFSQIQPNSQGRIRWNMACTYLSMISHCTSYIQYYIALRRRRLGLQ